MSWQLSLFKCLQPKPAKKRPVAETNIDLVVTERIHPNAQMCVNKIIEDAVAIDINVKNVITQENIKSVKKTVNSVKRNISESKKKETDFRMGKRLELQILGHSLQRTMLQYY